MTGKDVVVYANLVGAMKQQAERIVESVHVAGLKRLIFISTMGIYGEVPGERYKSVLEPDRDSAAVIEASDLDYTILRPGCSHTTMTSSAGSRRKASPSRATTFR